MDFATEVLDHDFWTVRKPGPASFVGVESFSGDYVSPDHEPEICRTKFRTLNDFVVRIVKIVVLSLLSYLARPS